MKNTTQQIRIFIAGDRSQVGKSSICLGILGSLLQMNYQPSSLAYIKPATQCEQTQLVAEYCEKHGIQAQPVGPIVYYRGFTRAFLQGETQSSTEMLEQVSSAVDEIAKGKAVVVIDGVGYPAVGSITNTDNAHVAMASGYASQDGSARIPPAVLIVGKRGVGDAVDSYNLNSNYFRSKNIPILGAIFNRLPVDGYYSLENCKEAVSAYFEQQSTGERVFGFIPEVEGIAKSRTQGGNDDDSDEKKNGLDLAIEHAETFIKAFAQNVDVEGILQRAPALRDSYAPTNTTSEGIDGNVETMQPNKKARRGGYENADVHKLNNSLSTIQLTRSQVEEAARAAGAAGG
jgi:dethiobiotin synthetase